MHVLYYPLLRCPWESCALRGEAFVDLSNVVLLHSWITRTFSSKSAFVPHAVSELPTMVASVARPSEGVVNLVPLSGIVASLGVLWDSAKVVCVCNLQSSVWRPNNVVSNSSVWDLSLLTRDFIVFFSSSRALPSLVRYSMPAFTPSTSKGSIQYVWLLFKYLISISQMFARIRQKTILYVYYIRQYKYW